MRLRTLLLMLMMVWLCQPPRAIAQTRPASPFFEYGTEGLQIPPQPRVNQTSPRTVTLLGEALREGLSPTDRVEVLRDLGACQLDSGLPYLVAAMADPDPMVRAEAARAAGAIGAPAAAAELKKLLKDGSAQVRREAVVAGAALGDPSFAAAGLEDPDSAVVRAALRVSSTEEHARIIAAKCSGWAPVVQVDALRALGRLKSAAHADAAGACLWGAVPVQVAALEALGAMGAREKFDAVHALVSHQHPTVRRSAVASMAGVSSPDQQRAVAREVSEDPDDSVREAAARLLLAHPSPDRVAWLAAQLSSDYPPLHDAAREALAAAGDAGIAGIVDLAAELLATPDPRRKEDGSFLLGHLRSDAALSEHLVLLGSDDLELVRQVAWSLGRIGRPEAGPPLAALAAHLAPLASSTGDSEASCNPAGRACAQAVLALGRIGYRPALETIKSLISRDGCQANPVRAAAVWAFGVLGDPAGEAETCSMLLRFYGNPYESPLVKFEGLKALGNIRYVPAASALDSIRRQEPSNRLRWMAHRSYDRISGTSTPYSPVPEPWSADVSREDRPN